MAFICILPVLIALGVWQLNRAEAKRSLVELQSTRQATDSVLLSASLPDISLDLLFKPAKGVGHYDNNHQFLLDNQVRKGRPGFFVLTPFLLKSQNKAVLVNRGWVPLGKHRSDLPDINVENTEITLTGRINLFPGVGLKLAGAEIPSAGWPALVQVVDANALAKKLGYPLYGFQIELDKAAANGFVREWQEPMAMTPEKHVGYAVQWFLLAITLTVLFIKYGIDNNND